jgi:hypothetical protein
MFREKNLCSLAVIVLLSLFAANATQAQKKQPCTNGKIWKLPNGPCVKDIAKSNGQVISSPYIPPVINFMLNQKTTIQLDSTRKKEGSGQAEILRSNNNINIKVSGLKSSDGVYADGVYTVYAVNKVQGEGKLTLLGSIQVSKGVGEFQSREKLSSFGIVIVEGQQFDETRLVAKSTVVK